MKRPAMATAMAVLTVLALGACSDGGGAGKSASLAVDRAEGGGQKAAAPDAGGGVGSQARGAQAAPAGLLSDAKIRTAQIVVDVKGSGRVAATAEDAARIATGVGGEVDADERDSGPTASAIMQLRVPPGRLGTVLEQLAALGKERHRQLSVTDVSEKVADVDSRVTSAEQAIARLRVLYSSATKVGEIIAIEGELSQREADLESLQAQQRTLARQTAMAVITLTLQATATGSTPAHRKDHGFLGGLRHGWDRFAAAAGWVATAVGTVIPFLVLIMLLALAGRLIWRRVPRHPRPAPTPAE